MAPFKKSGGYKGGDRQGGFARGGSDRPRFASKSFSRGNDRGRDEGPQMFSATCAQCHKTCEVPFRPNGEKPVFCRDCFGAKRGNEHGDERRAPRDFTPRDYDRPAPAQPKVVPDSRFDEIKRQVETINKRLDTIVQMIEGLALAPVAKPTKKAETLSKVVTKVAKKAAKAKK